MKQVGTMGMMGIVARVFLSLIVITMFGMALNLVVNIHGLFVESQNALQHPPAIHVGSPSSAQVAGAPVQTFWPEYPHNDPGMHQSSTVNGVKVITEEWQCGASPDDILAYYRTQMASRGWEDTTKQVYTLQPEMRSSPGDFENAKYINNYHDIIDSTLMFNRGDWSLRISAEPAKEGFRQTTVNFYAAQTMSIVDLAQSTLPAVLRGPGQSRSPLDVVQKNGTESYHTTITTSDKDSREAFREALADAAAKGWRPAFFRQPARGYFVWLTKGKQYAALTVNNLDNGSGCSITFVEVKPN